MPLYLTIYLSAKTRSFGCTDTVIPTKENGLPADVASGDLVVALADATAAALVKAAKI